MKLTAVYILLTMVASVIIYSFTTFATIRYVDDNNNAVIYEIRQNRKTIKILSGRIYELIKQRE